MEPVERQIPVKRGRPANPFCPTCIEEGIMPPRPRCKPGHKCTEHDKVYTSRYSNDWNRRQRARLRVVKNHKLLLEWVLMGAIESAASLLPEIEADLKMLKRAELAFVESQLTPRHHQAVEGVRKYQETADRMASNDVEVAKGPMEQVPGEFSPGPPSKGEIRP